MTLHEKGRERTEGKKTPYNLVTIPNHTANFVVLQQQIIMTAVLVSSKGDG